jgi:hypothetical protein
VDDHVHDLGVRAHERFLDPIGHRVRFGQGDVAVHVHDEVDVHGPAPPRVRISPQDRTPDTSRTKGLSVSEGNTARSVRVWNEPTRMRTAITAISAAMPSAATGSTQDRPAELATKDASTPSVT